MRYWFLTICILNSLLTYAQLGGLYSFNFTNVPANAKLVALGGVNVSLANNDVFLGMSNPALNGDTLSGGASFSYLDYFADVSFVTAQYQHDFGRFGNLFFGLKHVDYGTIEATDPTGLIIGNFESGESQLIIGKSHQVRQITIGGSIKLLNSNIAGFNSMALTMDIGGVVTHSDKDLSFGLVFKNIGVVLKEYSPTGNQGELPFDVQLGCTYKPEHMPFRFSITGYNLTKTNIQYFDANIQGADKPNEFDNIFRHINIGTEMLLFKNVVIMFGYNHLLRQELKLPETGGGAGFSFGLEFFVKTIQFSYARGGYHAAGGSNCFTVAINTNTLLKNRNNKR